MNMEQDDDTQQEVSITQGEKGTLIPDGPYPPIMEGTLNYFDSSPQGSLSHANPPRNPFDKTTTMYEGCMGFT